MHISVQSPTIIILSVSSKFKLSNAKKPLVEFFLTIFILSIDLSSSTISHSMVSLIQ